MGRRTGTGKEPVDRWRLPLTAAEEHRKSSTSDGRRRRGSVEEVGGSPGPGAPDVTGDLSRHGQARRLRRSPWRRSANEGQPQKALLSVDKEERGSVQQGPATRHTLPHRVPTHSSTVQNKNMRQHPRTNAFRRRRIITLAKDWKKGVKGGEKRENN